MGVIQWPLSHRLFRRVKINPETGCLLWEGALKPDGYGVIGLGTRDEGIARVHKVAWELAKGPVPKGKLVLHKCNVRNCVNVDHLYIGTDADNAKDRRRAGTGANQYGRFICRA